ncbi:MAG TPA: type II toxin-antitoxin system VapC family toxin, partial [Acidimicrobiales bacterium]|nr:type II toxin-antitoxin system VapC family toxin [Acidimicrobiales bacterium]
ELGQVVGERIDGEDLHVPGHFDAEVLSALGRLHRANELTASEVEASLRDLAALPVERHGLETLLAGAWARRSNLRLADALYVELAVNLGALLVTTDGRLAAQPQVEVLS